MAAITPAGFQNHMMNPLAQVLWAVLNGAQDMRRDERADRRDQRDREQALGDREQAKNDGVMAALAKLGIDGSNMTVDDGNKALVNGYAREAQQTQFAKSRAEERARQEHALQMQLLKNKAFETNPIVSSVKGAAGGLKDILEAAIRHGGSSQQRQQIVMRDGIPHYLTESGLQPIPMARPGAGGAPAAAGQPAQSDYNDNLLRELDAQAAKNGGTFGLR